MNENQIGGKTGFGVGSDRETIATIYNRQVFMKAASEEAGHSVYQEFPFIIIKCPGMSKQVIDRKLTEDDKRRFPDVWKAFEEDGDVKLDGVPIEAWSEVPGARAAGLKASGIHTVEMMAAVPDGNTKNLGPDGMMLKQRAKKFLEKRAGDDVKSIQDENRALKDELAELRAMVQKLTDSKQDIPAPKAKRGRPKNDAANNSTGRA